MSAQKLIVIIGATGGQGGSVVKALLGDPATKASWKIRGTTRDPQSEKAKALTAQGVECVSADLNSKSSLVAAFKDAHAVFAVTNYWEKADMQLEITQGKNVADAAAENNVKHLVWSNLLDVNKLSKGKFADVYHFDSKAQIGEYIKSRNIPYTFWLPGFYMSNIPGGMFRQNPDDNNAWTLAWPVPADTPFPLLATDADTGKFVKAIIENPSVSLGKEVLGATAYYTPTQIVDTFKSIYPEAGATAKYVQLPGEVFKGILEKTGMPEPQALEFLQNFLFIPEFGYYGGADIGKSLEGLGDLHLTTWEEFTKQAPAWKDLK